jgi:hypothetical protein
MGLHGLLQGYLYLYQYSDWATGWTIKVRFLAEAKDFSLLHGIQTSYGAYSASFMSISVPNSKAAGA